MAGGADARVEVRPDTFRFVRFDAADLAAVAGRLAAEAGIGGAVVVEVDEASPLALAELRGLDPVHLFVESGAVEDPRRLRHFSAARATEVFGRLLLQAADARRPGFGAPPLEERLPNEVRCAWDTWALGRLAAAGHEVAVQRRRYHFRVRHGFTDRADAAFDRLWNEQQPLTYAELEAISADARG